LGTLDIFPPGSLSDLKAEVQEAIKRKMDEIFKEAESVDALINIIVPTTGEGGRYLEKLLPIITQEKDCVVTVVDNASVDNTADICRAHNVKYFFTPENKGFAYACNWGAKAYDVPYLLFLNNDTEPEPGFSGLMMAEMLKNATVGIVGAKLLFMLTGKIQHAGISFYDDGWPYEYGRNFAPDYPPVNFTREVNAVTAACMLVRRDLYVALGGFDEGFKNGWEDVNLALEAREAGVSIIYCAEAVVHHRHMGSPGRLSLESENRSRFGRIWIESKRVFPVVFGKGE
jgi:O-antigen biosynthesis protein